MVDQRRGLRQLVGPSVRVGCLGLATGAGLLLGVVGNGPGGAVALLLPPWMGFLRGSGMTRPGMGTFSCHCVQAAPCFPWEVWDGPRNAAHQSPIRYPQPNAIPPLLERKSQLFLISRGVAFFFSSFSRSPERVGIAGSRCGEVDPVRT